MLRRCWSESCSHCLEAQKPSACTGERHKPYARPPRTKSFRHSDCPTQQLTKASALETLPTSASSSIISSIIIIITTSSSPRSSFRSSQSMPFREDGSRAWTTPACRFHLPAFRSPVTSDRGPRMRAATGTVFSPATAHAAAGYISTASLLNQVANRSMCRGRHFCATGRPGCAGLLLARKIGCPCNKRLILRHEGRSKARTERTPCAKWSPRL